MDKEILKKQLAALRENYEIISDFLHRVEKELFSEETVNTYLRLKSYKIGFYGFHIFAKIYSESFPDINIGKIEICIPNGAHEDIWIDEYGKLQNFNIDTDYTFDITNNGGETYP